jgi:hypothetical protein
MIYVIILARGPRCGTTQEDPGRRRVGVGRLGTKRNERVGIAGCRGQAWTYYGTRSGRHLLLGLPSHPCPCPSVSPSPRPSLSIHTREVRPRASVALTLQVVSPKKQTRRSCMEVTTWAFSWHDRDSVSNPQKGNARGVQEDLSHFARNDPFGPENDHSWSHFRRPLDLFIFRWSCPM